MIRFVTRIVILFMLYGIGVRLSAAQSSPRPLITRENAAQVEQLATIGAQRGWTVWSIAFSLDGRLFAAGGDDNAVILYDVIDAAPYLVERATLSGHQGSVYSVAFHPNSDLLAAGGRDGQIIIWDIASGEPLQTIIVGIGYETEARAAIEGIAFSPDGTLLGYATFQGSVRVVRWTDNTQIEAFETPEQTPAYSVAFHPDGVRIAYGDTYISEINPDVYAPASTTTLATQRVWFDSYTSERSKVTFSADGSVLLNSGTDQTSYLWHLDNLSHVITMPQGIMALNPDGTLAAGDELFIYNTDDGTALRSPSTDLTRIDTFRAVQIRDAVFSPDGRLIVIAKLDGVLHVWGIAP